MKLLLLLLLLSLSVSISASNAQLKPPPHEELAFILQELPSLKDDEVLLTPNYATIRRNAWDAYASLVKQLQFQMELQELHHAGKIEEITKKLKSCNRSEI